jgi:hypothetical protein
LPVGEDAALQNPYASETVISIRDEAPMAVILQFDESLEGARTLGDTSVTRP